MRKSRRNRSYVFRPLLSFPGTWFKRKYPSRLKTIIDDQIETPIHKAQLSPRKALSFKVFFAKQDTKPHEHWPPLPHYRTLLNISRTIPSKQQNILNEMQALIENTRPFTIDLPLHRTLLLLFCQSTLRTQIHIFHSKKTLATYLVTRVSNPLTDNQSYQLIISFR